MPETLSRRQALHLALLGAAGYALEACGLPVNEPTPPADTPRPADPTSTRQTDRPTATSQPPTKPPETLPPATASPKPSKHDAVISLDPQRIDKPVNRSMIGFGLDKRLDWLENQLLPRAIQDTQAGIVRFGSAQNALWNLHPQGQPKSVETIIDHTVALGQRIRALGAKPLCIITGYPDGFTQKDWKQYGQEFVSHLVRRCAETGAVHDFELWNEPDIETDDGKIQTLSSNEYIDLINTVIPMMREASSDTVIYGPAAPHKDSHLIQIALDHKLFDVITHHNYAAPVTDDSLETLIEYNTKNYRDDLRNKIAQYPRWGITEFNASPTYDFGPFANPDTRTEQYAGIYYMLASFYGWSVAAECMILYALDEYGDSRIQALAPGGLYRRRVDALKVLGNNVGTHFTKVADGEAIGTHPVNDRLHYISSINNDSDKAHMVLINTDPQQAISVGINLVGQTPPDAQISYFSMNRGYNPESLPTQSGQFAVRLEGISAAGLTFPIRRMS